VKVLLITPEFPPDFGGGIVAYCRDLAEGLREHGCTVDILRGSGFTHGSNSYEHEGFRISVLETERFHSWFDRFGHFAIFPMLRRHLAASFALHEQATQQNTFDIIEVTDWGLLFLPWVVEAQENLVVQLHGSTGQIAYHEPVVGAEVEGTMALLLERSAMEAAPILSSGSRSNALWWETLLSRRINKLLPPLRLRAAGPYNSSSNKKWICAGRIQQWKGPEVACSAWELLGARAPCLDWIGRDTRRGISGDSMDASLRKRFPATWGRNIEPVGQVSSDEVLGRMRSARAVIVPSTWDVFNLAAAEAMALQKVVVISDGAGAVDLVDHGVNGFVFPSGNAGALAELVQHVENLSDKELQRIGQLAAETVRQKLDPVRIAAEKLKLYRAVSQDNRRLTPWLRECLLPSTPRVPFGFLDMLPLKELSSHVLRRGLRKTLRPSTP